MTTTGTFLDRIVERTARDLAVQKRERPLSTLEAELRHQADAVPFAASLRRSGIAVIAEIKRASPSKGPIAPEADAAAVAADYLAGGAAAISVLTDMPFFGGSLVDLSNVAHLARGDRAPRPVLRKDFLIDPYQVAEARVAGADAVLLIVALLQGTALSEMLAAVRERGLQALVEVHDEAELVAALAAGAEVIGINNRDLRSFQVDLATSERLAPLVPPERTVVAESGIHTVEDVRRLAAAGAHAFLVGESLMRAPDRRTALAELLR